MHVYSDFSINNKEELEGFMLTDKHNYACTYYFLDQKGAGTYHGTYIKKHFINLFHNINLHQQLFPNSATKYSEARFCHIKSLKVKAYLFSLNTVRATAGYFSDLMALPCYKSRLHEFEYIYEPESTVSVYGYTGCPTNKCLDTRDIDITIFTESVNDISDMVVVSKAEFSDEVIEIDFDSSLQSFVLGGWENYSIMAQFATNSTLSMDNVLDHFVSNYKPDRPSSSI